MCEKEALKKFDNMAYKLALKFSYVHEFEDMYQVAKIGIIDAVRTFNIEKGAKLSTHVFNMILSHLRKFNSKDTGVIYYPPHVSDKNISLTNYNEELKQTYYEESYESVELKYMLDKAMSNLTEKQRQIIHLRYVLGFSVPEIANFMNCSHQNVSAICNKAKNILISNLDMNYL